MLDPAELRRQITVNPRQSRQPRQTVSQHSPQPVWCVARLVPSRAQIWWLPDFVAGTSSRPLLS
jgi:hypothetical protein